jgi:putative flippase GtrA
MTEPSLFKHGLGYGLVGFLQLLVDWLCFICMTSIGVATVPANLAARVLGALLGFWLNGVITFRDSRGSRLGWCRLRKFLVSWSVMSALSTLAVYAVDDMSGLKWAWAVKPVVDGGLAAIGFLASRYWIYK